MFQKAWKDFRTVGAPHDPTGHLPGWLGWGAAPGRRLCLGSYVVVQNTMKYILPIFQNFCSSLRSDIAAGSVSAGLPRPSAAPQGRQQLRPDAAAVRGPTAAVLPHWSMPSGRPVARRICSGGSRAVPKFPSVKLYRFVDFREMVRNGVQWG